MQKYAIYPEIRKKSPAIPCPSAENHVILHPLSRVGSMNFNY